MGWEDIEEMPTIGLRDELLTLLDKELEYGLPPPGGGASSSPSSSHAQQLSPSSSPPSSYGGGEVGGDGNNTVLSAYEEMRRNVCQWNYECVDYFLFDREVVYYSMHYYDRYHNNNNNNMNHGHYGGASSSSTSTSTGTPQQQQQPSTMVSHLLALSSLYLACKIHGTAATDNNDALPTTTRVSSSDDEEDVLSSSSFFTSSSSRRRIGLQQFCIMSRGAYCPQMLEEMEVSLLTNLRWRLHPPSPTDFLIRFVKILSLLLKDDNNIIVYAATTTGSHHQQQQHSTTSTAYNPTHNDNNVGKGWSVFEVARYQLELAVYSSELCHNVLPSKIAFAAILNALDSR